MFKILIKNTNTLKMIFVNMYNKYILPTKTNNNYIMIQIHVCLMLYFKNIMKTANTSKIRFHTLHQILFMNRAILTLYKKASRQVTMNILMTLIRHQ